MSQRDYLLSFGKAGDFGRFCSETPLPCRRGDKLVVRSSRGQELGVVIRPATEQHAAFLQESYVGQILRRATEGDLSLGDRMRRKSEALFGDARQLAGELNVPFEILDAEILLDGRQAVLYYLRAAECDPRALLDRISQSYHLLVTLHDLAVPREQTEKTEETGCGTEGCQSGAGGCGSCASGGCSSCGHAHAAPAAPVLPRPVVSLFSGHAS